VLSPFRAGVFKLFVVRGIFIAFGVRAGNVKCNTEDEE
jgi:hypothetical protein